ncbi:MAG: metallophosphoesterase [Chloroflexi bacterium]|nr:metallophosphoesterase [Chloroflexota bacterium]MCI0580538.1 metallophosphoesterase [Chloroflexota bacterium]MCI0648111.1 metallophosphoesterase [Chloroflexota bacterium]MCI0730546.1 metallophosphoesterase [Chloroflexota bacterium]
MAINRRTFLKLLAGAMAGGGLAAVGGYGYVTKIEPEWLVVERVEVPLQGLVEALAGFRIVQLSDFHLYPYTQLDLIQEAVAMANELAPDLIVLTGDYVLETAEAIFELAPALAALNARHGVFAVLGNHDHWTDAAVVRAGLGSVGLPLLDNRGVTLHVGGSQLYLAGVDDCWSGQPDLTVALDGLPAGAPTILLAHEPDFADPFSEYGRVSLQLSGHSHGGQVRLPGIGALVLPPHGQKYDVGLNRAGDMWVYTNRGIGLLSPAVRFNCPPEITELTLVAA